MVLMYLFTFFELTHISRYQQEHEAILRERETNDSGITWKEYKSMTFTHMVSSRIHI